MLGIWFLLFPLGFATGVVAVLAAEAVVVFVLLKRLNRKTKEDEAIINACSSEQSRLDPVQSLGFASGKQGFIWILAIEAGDGSIEKAPKEPKKKKDFLEAFPVKKYAKIKDNFLLLEERDGFQTISLKKCTVQAVSATSLSSRKWAKRYPIKLENRTSKIYKGCKTFYIYLETSWEKESWCNALRLASCVDGEKLAWYAKLHEEFHSYLSSLNTEYPSLLKPSVGYHADQLDKETRIDGNPSKVRILWKKLAKKTSKAILEHKTSSLSFGREERRANEKLLPQDSASSNGFSRAASTMKRTKSSTELNTASPSSLVTANSEADSDDKFGTDEGTLCWNLFILRLFFDARRNSELKRFLLQRIQRTLSNIRTPTFIGEVVCTRLDTGNYPPYVHAMRVLPLDLNEEWAIEIDFEYSGGVVVDIETRLEVGELDPLRSVDDSETDSSSVGDVSSVLLEDFEDIGKQLNLSEGTEQGEDSSRDFKSSISSSSLGSRWKTIVNSIRKQFSQVPLCLQVKVASFKGTLQLQIKPPPSDQLWYCFTSMPDIDFRLDLSVGEHKISNGRIALFLVNRIKAAIRDSLVLPNFGSLDIPWMLAEKDDWVPRTAAPFIWLNREASNPNAMVEPPTTNSQPAEAGSRSDASKPSSSVDQTEINHQPPESSDAPNKSEASESMAPLEEMKTSVSGDNGQDEALQHRSEEPWVAQSVSRSLTSSSQESTTFDENDGRPRRMGRRARMLDLGKKMGEKLEEKRRHLEEKSRHIVEKMRGP